MVGLQDLTNTTIKLIRSYGVKVKKRLSQHFVVDSRLISELLDNILRFKPKLVVEVGTGLGMLTAYLAGISKYVVSIELDRSLAEVATKYVYEVGVGSKVDVVVVDGVKLLRGGFRDIELVVSNVPYNVTGPLINSIIKSNCRAAVLTLQKEVADRLVATPGSRGYSRLTVMVNTFMDVELGGLYSPKSFYPEPKVSSRVVVLRRVREWSDEWVLFEDLIRCLFNQRRKLAMKVLRRCVGVCDESVINDLVRGRRVYELPTDTLLNIYSLIYGRRL
jgi:16S rRNA (adenine1518-N6/adenine1519-N6)-dimethyltransferase